MPLLPEDFKAVGARLRNWSRWGDDDRRGTLNFISAGHVAAAARHIKRGQIFELGHRLGGGAALAGYGHRPPPVHLMSMMPDDLNMPDGAGFADDFIMMPLQSAAHWDGLAHCSYDGQLYGGHPTSSITATGGATRLGIDSLLGGITGRGVLLDIASLKGVPCLPPGEPITPSDLDEAERHQNVRVATGDIVLIRTGWPQRHQARPRTGPRAAAPVIAGFRLTPEPGLSLECCAWLHQRQVAAVASDNYAIEVVPAEDPASTLPVHCVLIRDMGMTLGELFDLEALASDCAADRIWEFFFSAPPLKFANGLGSPVNPLAIK